jgi:peptidoglycan-N-acetylglucosamine deacetylase
MVKDMLQPGIAGGLACSSMMICAAYATFAPRAALWTPVIWRGDVGGPARVAITFDDGPSPDTTPRVLDCLGEMQVRAAFFVIGANAARYPALVRRIDKEGHVIGNHTFDHHHLGLLRRTAYWKDQLRRTDDVIEAETGRRPRYVRPPMGFKTPFQGSAVHLGSQHLITWTRRALDGIPTTSEQILHRLGRRTRAGDIILLHDGAEPHRGRNSTATVRAIRPLVEALRGRGLAPVRLDEIITPCPYMTPEATQNETGARSL